MQKLRIDQAFFTWAFGRDVDYHDAYPKTTYLDKETGDIVLVYENDNDTNDGGIQPKQNHRMRMTIAATPERYLKIPGRSHGEEHDILQEFLDSDWTASEKDRKNARNAYHRSIGWWLKTVEGSASLAYQTYREERVIELAEQFLTSHGVEPLWR